MEYQEEIDRYNEQLAKADRMIVLFAIAGLLTLMALLTYLPEALATSPLAGRASAAARPSEAQSKSESQPPAKCTQ